MSSLHEEGARRGELVLRIREQDLVIEMMNEAHKLLIAEKDAEIERLKALITELCDALEQQSCWSTKMELIQRAREATR